MAFRTVTRWFTALAAGLFVVTLSLTGAGVATPAGAAVPNSPPQAVDDVLFTPVDTSDTAVSIDVLANDTDPDGDPLTIDPAPYPVGTSNGLVDIDVATGRLLYTANNGFVGPETFTYDVTDGVASSTATVRVFVGFHSNMILDIAFDAPGQISKSAVLGLPTTYSIHATNASSFPAHDVTITNPVPSNFEVTSVSNTTACRITGNEITCHWNVLDPFDPAIDNSVGTSVELMPVATGVFTNSMTVTSLEDDPAQPLPSFDYASSVYQSSGTADLGALGSPIPATSSVGDHVVMSFNGQNYGPSVATDAVLTDTIPPNFRIDSINNQTDCAVAGNTVTCQRTTLSGFFETAVFLTAVAPGTWSNSATITSATPEAVPEYAANIWSTSGTVAGAGTGMLVTSITPSTRAVGLRNQTFDVRGGGFVSGARATVAGVPNANQRTTFVDSTHLTLTISRIPTGALIGPHDVTVTNPGTAGLRATCAGCLIFDPRPTLTSAAPAALPQRATANVVLTGTGFATGAVVSFGSGVTVNAPPSVGAGGTSLTVNVTIASNAGVGGRTVRVTNTDGGSVSRAVFRVNAAPVIFGVTPTALARGVARQVVINGARFATPSPAVSFGPGVNVLTVVRNSASKLTVSVTVSPGAAIGPRDLTVTNPDGGVATRTAAIRIL